jgi:multidrug resistance efflux pump
MDEKTPEIEAPPRGRAPEPAAPEPAAPEPAAPLPAAPLPAAAVPAVAPLPPSPYRRRTFTFLGILLLILVFWQASSYVFAYTDDAVLTADLVSIAPQVTGPLKTITVSDNQAVRAGDVVFTIDPTPFQLALDQANGAVSRAEAQVAIDQAALAAAQALQASAQAALVQADLDLRRANDLAATGFEAREGQEDAITAARRAADALAATQASAQRTQQMLKLDQAEIIEATAARALAQWRLSRTTVTAPVSGRITHFTLLPGDMATANNPLVALVAAHSWYVDANYKEGIIRHLRVGETGWIWLDSHPFHLYRARIQGIASGIDRRRTTPSGLLPYVDPTVDWIRLQARFPVRFQLVDAPPDAELLMGSDARTLVIY